MVSITESAPDRTMNRTGGRGLRLRGVDCAGWSGQVGVLWCVVSAVSGRARGLAGGVDNIWT